MGGERRRRVERPRGGSGWSPSGVAFSIVVHLLAVALIFLAPHPMPAPPPTAYTVEIVDPNALGGKLLAGPIGGVEAKAKPAPKAPPPEPPPPEPPPPEEPPPPPEEVAKVDEPPPPLPDDEDDEAVPLGTPVATVAATSTPRPAPTARPTQQPTARPTARPTANPTAKPSPHASATVVASAKLKASATPAIVVAKKGTPVPPAPSHRPDNAAPTPGSEARPKPGPTAGPSDDLDAKLAEAIKGVEAKAEKARGGIGGAAGPGGGQGGTEKTLNGPAGIGGEGPGGGGTVRGLEFVVYYNQMLNRIKDRWTWVGTRTDLRVTISFSILPSGEITNIRLTERSGDQSFDASVERAVKGAGPLPPPPEAYRSDFSDVEVKFRPADLQR